MSNLDFAVFEINLFQIEGGGRIFLLLSESDLPIRIFRYRKVPIAA